jgi:uncharacterized PurR-regulated membrane protein YhhQ (DUF165 family)
MKLSHYYKPTPKKWRKIGDALLATTTFLTGGGLIAFDQLKEVYTPKEIRIAIFICLILGVVSKFLTNFFKADEVDEVVHSKKNENES